MFEAGGELEGESGDKTARILQPHLSPFMSGRRWQEHDPQTLGKGLDRFDRDHEQHHHIDDRYCAIDDCNEQFMHGRRSHREYLKLTQVGRRWNGPACLPFAATRSNAQRPQFPRAGAAFFRAPE
jgi:hypothetical protein